MYGKVEGKVFPKKIWQKWCIAKDTVDGSEIRLTAWDVTLYSK